MSIHTILYKEALYFQKYVSLSRHKLQDTKLSHYLKNLSIFIEKYVKKKTQNKKYNINLSILNIHEHIIVHL